MSSEIEKLLKDDKKFDAIETIVNRLLDDENLATKTELDKPLRFSVLSILEQTLKDNNLKNSSKILTNFQILSFKYLISHNREGRKEYIQALQLLNSIQSENKPNPLNPIQIK